MLTFNNILADQHHNLAICIQKILPGVKHPAILLAGSSEEKNSLGKEVPWHRTCTLYTYKVHH